MHILGAFMPNLTAFCNFDGLLSRASFVSYSLYTCTTPTWLSASGVVPIDFIEVYPRPISSSPDFNRYALPDLSSLLKDATDPELNRTCSEGDTTCFKIQVGSFYFFPHFAELTPNFGDRRGLSDFISANASVTANAFGLIATRNYTCQLTLQVDIAPYEATIPRNSITQSQDLAQVCTYLQWGDFTDGSPPDQEYPINTFKCWILAPQDAQSLYLQFPRFETELDWDFVEIWDCFDIACSDKTLIRSLTGSPGPAEAATTSSSGVVLVTFHSDELINKKGFECRFEIFSVLSSPSSPLDSFRVVCPLPVWDINTPWKQFLDKQVDVLLLESADPATAARSSRAVAISGASSFNWTQVKQS